MYTNYVSVSYGNSRIGCIPVMMLSTKYRKCVSLIMVVFNWRNFIHIVDFPPKTETEPECDVI